MNTIKAPNQIGEGLNNSCDIQKDMTGCLGQSFLLSFNFNYF